MKRPGSRPLPGRFSLGGAMIKKAFFEAAFVVFGVVLALAANEWREGRADRAEARDALAAIHEEIRLNRDMVAEAIAAHEARLVAIGDPTTAAPPDMSAFSDGFMKPATALSTAAWDSAAQTGIFSHMEFETVRKLGTLYAHQDRYHDQVSSYASLIYETLYKDGYQSIFGNKRGLLTMIRTLKYQEEALLGVYDTFLTGLEG